MGVFVSCVMVITVSDDGGKVIGREPISTTWPAQLHGRMTVALCRSYTE
jgi:hypothetical protein